MRRDAGEPLPTAAVQQTEQNGLDLVVTMVSGDDIGGLDAPADLFERLVPHGSRCRLEARRTDRRWCNLPLDHCQLYTQAFADLPCAFSASGRPGVQAVVDVGGFDRDIADQPKAAESPQKRRRVGAAGERYQELVARLEHHLLAEEAVEHGQDSAARNAH